MQMTAYSAKSKQFLIINLSKINNQLSPTVNFKQKYQ